MDSGIWARLPEVRNVDFTYQGHRASEENWSEPEKTAPYDIFVSRADFEWDGIRFTGRREWFGAPRNPHLFLYRQTIEPSANCDFTMESWIADPDPSSGWTLKEYVDQEDNSCGMLLTNGEGRTGILCETTQITSFSLRVRETRKDCRRHYELMAFEESPIKLEKYVSFHLDDEEDFEMTAFKECRNASRIRFDDIRGRGAWILPKD